VARDLGIADRLRARGLKVVEIDGWKERGDDVFHPTGSVNHHTAGPHTGNAPSLAVCIKGRSDLPGPLCQVLKARDQTCYVIASGRANHAGKGGWNGQSGNSSVYGLECENAGTSDDPWSADDLATMAQVHAAFLEGITHPDTANVCQHWEWTPRKIDAHDINGSRFRDAVRAALAPPPPPPHIDPKDYDMPIIVKGDSTDPDPHTQRPGQWWLTDGLSRRPVVDGEEGLALIKFYKVATDPRDKLPEPFDAVRIPQEHLDRIPVVMP